MLIQSPHAVELDSLTVIRFSHRPEARDFPPVIVLELAVFGSKDLLRESMSISKAEQMWLALGRAIVDVKRRS
jgi:hypothetical protein